MSDTAANRERRGFWWVDEVRPFEITLVLPWPNRRKPFVSLNVSQWGWEVRRGKNRRVLHILLIWGWMFSDRARLRSWDMRGRWT